MNPQLTNRETEVLKLTIKGLTAKESAKILGISPGAIVRHLVNIREKLEAPNTINAAFKCLKLNIISLADV